jgi:hypothetical protein
MKPGDTFLLRGNWIGPHLHLVLAVLEDGSVLLCHFTTLRARSDRTCIIEPGEHPFFRHPSVPRYDQIHVCPADRMDALQSSISKQLQPFSDSLLERVRQGALASPQTPDKYKAILRQMLNRS